MGWSFFNDVFRCTERDVPCGRDVRFGTLRIKIVIASKNTGTPRDTVYSRGKGAHEQKSEHYCLQ